MEKMGDGAFSNVYKAIERKTGRKVAVKVVRKYELNSSQVRIPSSIVSIVSVPSVASSSPFCHLLRPGQARMQVARVFVNFALLFLILCT